MGFNDAERTRPEGVCGGDVSDQVLAPRTDVGTGRKGRRGEAGTEARKTGGRYPSREPRVLQGWAHGEDYAPEFLSRFREMPEPL